MPHDTTAPRSRHLKSWGNFDLVPRDFDAIDVNMPSEVAYWCASFRCTGSQLRSAITAVGPSSKAVAHHLQSLARRPKAEDPVRSALTQSSVREVVEATLHTLLPPANGPMFHELLERVVAHRDVALLTNERWVTLSPKQAATVAQVVANIADESRERDGHRSS